METQEYKVEINAPRERVWTCLWEDAHYRDWTSAFAPGSAAETDWQTGSKVLFTDGKGSGMVSEIAENRPNEYMSIRHLGILKDGVEDMNSEEAKEWTGSLENYTLETVNGKTALTVSLETRGMSQEMIDMFAKMWPNALKRLKEISEQ